MIRIFKFSSIYCKRFLREVAERERNHVINIHQKKLNRLNGGLVGQDFGNMNSKVTCIAFITQ
jgi:hypothetical protein